MRQRSRRLININSPMWLRAWPGNSARARSEEHTSELQSQSNLVCRLLIEKKKRSLAPLSAQRIRDKPAIQANKEVTPASKGLNRASKELTPVNKEATPGKKQAELTLPDSV